MDKNKLKVLRELPYRIHKTCGLCRWGQFGSGHWGTCGQVAYEHAKHSTETRELSIHVSGNCDRWAANLDAVDRLREFAEFLK